MAKTTVTLELSDTTAQTLVWALRDSRSKWSQFHLDVLLGKREGSETGAKILRDECEDLLGQLNEQGIGA